MRGFVEPETFRFVVRSFILLLFYADFDVFSCCFLSVSSDQSSSCRLLQPRLAALKHFRT